MNERQELERGAQARALWDHPLMQEALATIEERIISSWRASPIRDVEGQQHLRIMLGLLEQLKGHLQEVMETGRMASIELERKRGLREMVGAWRR